MTDTVRVYHHSSHVRKYDGSHTPLILLSGVCCGNRIGLPMTENMMPSNCQMKLCSRRTLIVQSVALQPCHEMSSLDQTQQSSFLNASHSSIIIMSHLHISSVSAVFPEEEHCIQSGYVFVSATQSQKLYVISPHLGWSYQVTWKGKRRVLAVKLRDFDQNAI